MKPGNYLALFFVVALGVLFGNLLTSALKPTPAHSLWLVRSGPNATTATKEIQGRLAAGYHIVTVQPDNDGLNFWLERP